MVRLFTEDDIILLGVEVTLSELMTHLMMPLSLWPSGTSVQKSMNDEPPEQTPLDPTPGVDKEPDLGAPIINLPLRSTLTRADAASGSPI